MRFYDNKLTEPQNMFLQLFLTRFGENNIGEKLEIVRHGKRKYARIGREEIPLSISDDEIIQLAQYGYLEIYSTEPIHIAFTKLTFEKTADKVEKGNFAVDRKSPLSNVLTMDIIQVYAWLGACLIAGLLSLFLLFLTVQQIFAQNISVSIGSGITTLISSLLSVVFLKNYDKANDRLKHLRSLSANEERETKQ
jgi:hypothetical protein